MRGDNTMTRNTLRRVFVALALCSALTFVEFHQVCAQVVGTESQVVKWLSNSALRSWFSNMGSEIEYGRRDRQTYIAVDQIDGLCWPNEFNVRMKGVKAAKALWIGTTNFTDPVSGARYPYKVVCAGKDRIMSGTEFFADELTLAGKFQHPSVYVDNTRASARDYDDIIDDEDNTLSADREMINRFHTSIGISVTRRILSFSQQYNNNYYVYEYTLKNTGIIDETGQKKLNVPLTGVVLYLQSRLAFPGVAYNGIGLTGAGGWTPGTTSWGRNTINDVVRMDGTSPGEFRAVFSYWGPMSTSTFNSPTYATANPIQGDIGLPGPNATNVTVLGGYEFAGTVVLHADRAANDPTDDITQPTTTMYAAADNTIDRNNVPTQYNDGLMTQKYQQYMTVGHAPTSQADQIGKDANGWPTGAGNTFGNDAGGYQSAQGFGPYTLNPGDSVRIVVAEAVAGISWNKACEVAQNWWTNNTSAFALPAGFAAANGRTLAADRNEYKAAWVFSGKDSLFQTFRRAIANYNGNYNIPQPPPPPDQFTVNSGGDRIRISWSPSAESAPHFDGYRLYRSEGRTDTTYDLLFECGKAAGNLVNTYDDQNARRGFNYYYYIQSKSDGLDNPGDGALNIPAGEPLVSSRYYTMTNNPAHLTRPAGAAITTISNTATFQGDDSTKNFILPTSIADSTGTIVFGLSVSVNGVKQIPAAFSVALPDTLRFVKAPLGTIEVTYTSATGARDYRLSQIRVVPNPYNIKARNIQYGTIDPTTLDRIGFYNLPPVCKIRIYTELGDLIATLDHSDGSGEEYWQSLTSSRQIVVSGLYIAYFEVTQDATDNTGNLIYRKGDSIVKKFVIIR
jgi:hypothetical protein